MTNDRIEKLQEEIAELQDLLLTLTLSVQYSEDNPFLARVARYQIAGEKRTALNMVLASIQARAEGHEPPQVKHPAVLEPFPVIAEAQKPGSIDLAEAIRLVAQIVGNQEKAFEILKAHQASGFGVESYQNLGLGLH